MFYVLIKGAFVGRIILYLTKCTVKQQLKFMSLNFKKPFLTSHMVG